MHTDTTQFPTPFMATVIRAAVGLVGEMSALLPTLRDRLCVTTESCVVDVFIKPQLGLQGDVVGDTLKVRRIEAQSIFRRQRGKK